jgi:SAM-dependent methyltransferase
LDREPSPFEHVVAGSPGAVCGDRLAGLRCPKCASPLTRREEQVVCQNAACGAAFPVVDGVPIVIDEGHSVFAIDEIIREHRRPRSPSMAAARALAGFVPALGRNAVSHTNYPAFARLLAAKGRATRVLVLGGRILGDGLSTIIGTPGIQFLETDVGFGPRTRLVCDAHEIPFPDETFDGVIIQAVLEHVVDPYRCVEEVHRVLRDGGIVYAETPFMQQVHSGRYDFTRFTDLGHRRLFRRFEETSRGPGGGPGSALAWSYSYFLLSFPRSRPLRIAMRVFAALTAFWLKYFDRLLLQRPGAQDAAWGFYFLGRKSARVLSDRELIGLYRGAGTLL